MKSLAIILSFAAIIASGCSSLSSYEKGVVTGGSAQVIFDAPQDEAKFQKIKEDIETYLESGKPITEYVVDQYALKLRDDFSPAFLSLVVERLKLELGNEFGYSDESVREFLQGLADSIK